MTFATEHNWDSLDFFDGVDGNAPRLGSYSGKSDQSELKLSAQSCIEITHCNVPTENVPVNLLEICMNLCCLQMKCPQD